MKDSDDRPPEAIGDATPRLSNCNPLQSTRQPLSALQPDLQSVSSTSSSQLDEQWKRVLQVPPDASSGNYDNNPTAFHPVSQSFSSLENDSALKDFSDAFGSSLSSSAGGGSYNDEKRLTTTMSIPQQQIASSIKTNNNNNNSSKHSSTSTTSLDDERQSTDALLQIMASLEQDALRDIRQALHETTSTASSSSSIHPLMKRKMSTTVSKTVTNVPSLSSSACSPPSDFYPMDDESISITDSFVLHRTVKKRKKGKTTERQSSGVSLNDDESDEEDDSTIVALQKQVELLNNLLDDMHQRLDPTQHPRESFEDGLDEEISRLEQCEHLIQAELKAIDQVLWMSPSGILSENDHYHNGDNDEGTNSARRSDAGIDSGDKETRVAVDKEAKDGVRSSNPGKECSAESTDTTETSNGIPTETNQMGKDGTRERESPTAEIEIAIFQPKESYPADNDLQQLQEQMQREELQAPEARDEVVEVKDCRSCEEIVEVASASWSDLQALKKDLQWGAATNNNTSIAVNIRIDPQKLPQDTETDPEFDAAPVVKDNINKNVEDMSEDIDDNLLGSVPRRIYIANPLSPTKSLPSLENTTLGFDGVSSSETMESSMESNVDKDDDDARIERLAAQARAHTQASLLAITTMARGLDNKSPPRRRIPVQNTTSPRIATGLSVFEAQSPSEAKGSLICAPEVFSLTSSPSYHHSDAKDQIPITSEQAFLPSKEMDSRGMKSYHIPDDHLQLYEDTDKVLADRSDTCKEKRPGTHVFRTVASPAICDAAAKKMLTLEKLVLQNAQLSEKNNCVDDCRDVGEGIEQTMSRFLEDNCIVMDHLIEPPGISSPLSQHTMTSLADAALNEHSSCEESVLHSEAAKGSGYQHVPSLERMMNSSPQKLVEQSRGPSVLLQTGFICNQRTSLNDAACDRISKLRQRRPLVLADAFVSEFEDEELRLATPKEQSEKIHDMKMKSSWMDEDVESLPDTPVFLGEEAERRTPLDVDFPSDETADRKEQKQPYPLVRKKPFGNITSKGPKTTNPFEHEEEDRWIEDRRFREQNSTNPFDDPNDDLNPFNNDCHNSDNSLANTMTTTTTIADQPNLNFELDFASDVVPISISPSASPVNEDEAEKKATSQSLEAIVSSPRDLRSAPSDEFCNVQSPIIRRCPSDEGMGSALGDRPKRVLASLTPTPRSTIGAPSDEGGLPFLPSKISKMLSEGTFRKGTSTPKKRRKYLSALLSVHSVRKQLSPKKIPRKSLVALKDAATSPISAVLRSLPSIREEKSAESNENTSCEDETRSLLQAPTDEGWNNFCEEDDASKEYDIHDTLSRLAARIQGRASADDVDSAKATTLEKEKASGDDPLYDCVDRICGDENVSTLHRRSQIGDNNEGLEKVMTIDSTGRLLSANNSDFTSGENDFVAPSASAEDKIRGVGIHVTCISQKHSTLPMSEEVPSLGIELVYYEEDRFTMTAAATESRATSEENELDDDSQSMEATAKEGCVQRSDEQPSQEDTEEDTFGFPVEDNYFSHVVPKSISFVDRPGMRNDGTEVQNATDIVKAVSYHNDHDVDRLLEEHPIQTSLWTKVQESRLKAKEDSSSTTTSINSSMVAHTGTDRDPTRYCDSIETLQHQDSTTTNTTAASASFQSSSYHGSITAHRYDAIVQRLLNKTQRLLDSMMKFDYPEFASLTTDDITGVQMDGRFLQGRSFHSYYGCTKKPTTMETAFADSKQKRSNQRAPSFLDQVPIQQSVLSPTVRLVSPQVAVVSYQVIRKTLEKGRVVERALYETRVWENRLPQGTTAGEGKIKQEEAETEDAWLNCHYHVSAIMAPAVTGGGASGNTLLSRSSAVASSLVAAQQKQSQSHNTATSSSNTNSSSSIPYYDI